MVLDKLKFWKKSDDLSSFSSLPNDPMAQHSEDPFAGSTDPLAQTQDPFANATPGINTDSSQHRFADLDQGSSSPTMTQPYDYRSTTPLAGSTVPDTYEEYPQGRDRDMELILAKLDSIKSELDSLHQRVRKIESSTEQRRHAW